MWAFVLLMLIRMDRQRYIPIEEKIVIEGSIPIDCSIADNPTKDLPRCPVVI